MPSLFLVRNKLFFLLFLALFLGSLIFASPHSAKALTVSPPRLEISADPGETIRHEIKLINEKQSSLNLYIVPQNFEAKNESGEPDYIEGRENLAGWINAPTSISLGPGEEKIFWFTISVPANAEPGGYFTALFFQANPPTFEEAGGIGIGSQLGSLILLKVNGAIGEEAGVLEFASKGKQRFFLSLPIEFYYRFQNTGDIWIKPLGEVFITNTFGRRVKLLSANRQKGNVLPKSIRKFETAWIHSGGSMQEDPNGAVVYPEIKGFWNNVRYQYSHFALGLYTAELHIAYGSDPVQIGESTFRFFVFPWQLVVVSLVVLIVCFLIIRIMIKRYNHAIIKRAQKTIQENDSLRFKRPIKK